MKRDAVMLRALAVCGVVALSLLLLCVIGVPPQARNTAYFKAGPFYASLNPWDWRGSVIVMHERDGSARGVFFHLAWGYNPNPH